VARKSEVKRGKGPNSEDLEDLYHTVKWSAETLEQLDDLIPSGSDLSGNISKRNLLLDICIRLILHLCSQRLIQ
jgi:hypothetical protein